MSEQTGISRKDIARIACTAVIAAGAWYALARPAGERLAVARAQLAHASTELDLRRTGAVSTADSANVLAELAARQAELTERFGRSTDPSRTYDAYGRLAREAGVTMERIEPTSASRASRQSPQSAQGGRSHFEQRGFTIDVTGSYEAVARFIGTVESELGLVRVSSIQLASLEHESKSQTVRATVETTHYLPRGLDAETAPGTPARPGTETTR